MARDKKYSRTIIDRLHDEREREIQELIGLAEKNPDVPKPVKDLIGYYDRVKQSGGICACDGSFDDGCYNCNSDLLKKHLKILRNYGLEDYYPW